MWSRALKNLDLFIGIALSIVIAILGVTGIASSNVVSSGVLAVLALLLATIIRIRGQLLALAVCQSIEVRALGRLEFWMENRGGLGAAFRHEYPDLSSIIRGAERVDIVAGLSLKTTVGMYHAQLEQAVENGARIRVVGPNPNNASLMAAAAISSAHQWRDAAAATRDTSLNLESAKGLRDSLNDPGFFEIRTTEVLPCAGIVIIRGSEDITLFKPMLYSGRPRAYPVLALDTHMDETFCAELQASFERMWSEAQPC